MNRTASWSVRRGVSSAAVIRLGLLALLAGCLAPVAAQDGLQRVRERGTLIWGADQEGGAPYAYPDPEDPTRLIGFEVDLAQLIAEHLGVRPQFAQGQWDKLPSLLDRGDIDIVLNGYEWLPQRAEQYGTSLPYYIYELQLLARQGDPSLDSWEDVTQPADGRRKRIGVLTGSAAHEYLETGFANQVEIVQFDGPVDAIRATELGTDGLDANLQDVPAWTFLQRDFPQIVPVGAPTGRGYYVVLTRKADRELLAAINDALLAGLRDGRIRKLLGKYGLWNAAQSNRGLEVDSQAGFVGDRYIDSGGVAQQQVYQPVRGWAVLHQRGWLLLQAAGVTVLLAVCAMPLAILIGLVMALGKLYGPRWLAAGCGLYIEIVRGTPLVLQLYVIFFLLPEIGLSLNALWAAVIGLAINYSAYEAEIYRAGLQAIPRGQWEAAAALGMSQRLTLTRVVIPQATRLVIPPMTNDFIALFKDTAVCSVITVVELSKQYYIHARSTGAIVELGILTAILYLAMSYPLSILARRLEERLMPERRR